MKKSFCAHAFVPALSVLSLAVASAVQAQTVELEPVVVSATRIEQKLSDVIPSATVITREEIERSQAPTLVDLIQGQPGVEIGRNGGPGSQASLFMRGQSSTNVAVFIDGVRVQTDHFGNVKFVDIPPSQIERVEILRGNMSAVYGEAATGGVIHVYTRAGTGYSGGNASFAYGSRNSVDASVGYQVNQDGWKGGFSLNRFETEGYSAQNVQQAPLANPDKDGYEREAVFFNLEKSVNPDLALGFQANAIDGKIEYDHAYGSPMDLHHSKTKTNDVAIYSKFKFSENWASRVGLIHSEFYADDFLRKGTIFENTIKSRGDQLSASWSNTYKLGHGNVTFGMDGVDAEFKSGAPSAQREYKRQSNASYVGYAGRTGALDYQANARHDSISAKSSTTTIKNSKASWLFGAAYQLTDDLKITGLRSTSFRAPNTGELFITAWGGNANLKPEEHRGSELGLQYSTAWGLLNVNYFETNTTNAIDGYPLRNTAKTKNSGIELGFSGSIRGVGYKASHVSQDPRNVVDNARLLRRAREYASFNLTSHALGFDWGADVIWSGSRPDGDIVTFNPVTNSSYTVVNLSASKKISAKWTGRVKVENAFDEKYQLAHGFNAVPRGVFVTLQYQPK